MAGLASLVLAGSILLATALPAAATHSLGPVPTMPQVPAMYVKQMLSERRPLTLIDLRPAAEYQVGRLPQARSIPLSELRRRSAEVPRTGYVVLYCGCQPGEAWQGYELLQVRGFRNIVMLVGGFSGWVDLGYPVEHS